MATPANVTPLLFDRTLLRVRQDRARKQGEVTFLLDRVAEDMADRISAVKRDFADVADIWTPGELLRTPVADRFKSVARIRLDGDHNVGDLGVQQMVFVKPGRYRFRAYVRTQQISTDQGLHFRVVSDDDQKQRPEGYQNPEDVLQKALVMKAISLHSLRGRQDDRGQYA